MADQRKDKARSALVIFDQVICSTDRGFVALTRPALRDISTSLYKIALTRPALRDISTSMYKIALTRPALRDISTFMYKKPLP